MSARELPRGTVTFLFTDIEGSTRLVKQLRDHYADVLTEHQRILREAFDAHSGREIDTQGDSFFVAFPRAKDAISLTQSLALELAPRAIRVNAVSPGLIERPGIHEDWPDGSAAG